MKHFKRHILIWLFLFYGMSANASHVLGGEIFYTHLKDNQYKITLNIYRDCNGCKINGSGGGTNPDNCSEIDYIFVKGTNTSDFKETKFALNREKITDITPSCRTNISTCNTGSNSIYGIELHQFSATIDLDNSAIKGFCNYYIYVTLAERNSNITTGQSKQNFCIDALINTCLNSKNNSPTFISKPTFIVNNNKTQYQNASTLDKDNDSLVYSLTPALFSLDKEVSYGTGFSYSNPLTTYCPEVPCNADKVKETGFYLDKSNGTIVYIPTRASEIGVVALKVEEFRKISGQWELIGYIKRDIQVNVKTNDGNASPKFLNKDYFEICEDEPFEIKIETNDERNSMTLDFDSVNYHLNTNIAGSSFTQLNQTAAPYNYGLFKWTPPIGASDAGIYSFSVSATDNFCPLNATSSQIIYIKVKPKEDLIITKRNLGCGNFEISSSKINSLSKLSIKVYSIDGVKKEIFNTNLQLDTISFLPSGRYLLSAVLSSNNGCKTYVEDTIININTKSQALIKGDYSICKNIDYNYSIDNLPLKYSIIWMINSQKIGSGTDLTTRFNSNETLKAILDYKKGKWECNDTLKKIISLIDQPEIVTNSKNEICHLSGNFYLNNISITPLGGKWSSSHKAYMDGIINTDLGLSYYDDTVILNYEVTNSGCVYSKDINFIILAVPEFELSTLTICEITSPVLFEHLIKKPYATLNYNFNWGFPMFPGKVKDFSGSTGFYPSDLGFGYVDYTGEITSNNGCKNFDTAIIEITPVLKIKFQNEINLCQGSGLVDITKLSGVTPDNGNWSFIDFDLIVDRKNALTDTCGVFEATYVYDNYGCFDSKKVNINIACRPNMTITGLKDNICDSELPVLLDASPAGGMWEGSHVLGNTFSPPLIPDVKKYTLSYIINQGICNFKESRIVSVIPAPTIDLNPDNITYCHPKSISINGQVSNTDNLVCKYMDNTFNESINNTKTFNNYPIFNSIYNKLTESQMLAFTATNDAGCITDKNIAIKVLDQPKIAPFNDTFVCEQSGYILSPTITYNGNNDLVYSWLENLKEINTRLNYNSDDLNVGMHSLMFKAGNEYCNDYKSVNIEVKPKPMVDFIIKPTNTTSIIQPTFWFQNQSGINKTSYWQFGNNRSDNYSYERSPRYTYIDTGHFIVSLTETDEYGCSNTLYQTVLVKPDLLIFIPNAFTPNNKDEEKNNVFSVSLQNYNTYSIEIYDRWGHKVFYSENPAETWDGKSGNVSCTPDIYFYSIKINSITNHLFKYRGTITLIK